MSNIPDSILKKGGFKTVRESRNTNSRHDCCFCPKKQLLHTSYGLHLFKEHIEDIFHTSTEEGKKNRASLFNKTYLDYPFYIEQKKGDFHACLGCCSVFKNEKKGTHHFSLKKPCLEKHKENILQLRDTFPKDGISPPRASLQNKSKLIELISKLLERIRAMERGNKFTEPFDYQKYSKFHEGWGLEDMEEDTLKEYWDDLEEDEKLLIEENNRPDTPPPLPESPSVPESTPLPPPEDDILPLVVPKPPTQLQMLEELLKDPSLDEASRRALQKQVSIKTAAPPPAPVVKEEIKMTPWEKLYYGYPNIPIAELIMIAQRQGITPDSHSNIGIIGNTKVQKQKK